MDSIQVNAGVHVAAEVVLLPRQRGGEAHRRLAVAGALAFLCVLAGSALLSQHTGERAGAGVGSVAVRPAELLRTTLRLRSANLVIKDLAGEWDEVNFQKEPFDFCGKATMTSRQVKVCAEYFLSSRRDKLGDDSKGEGKQGTVLHNFPKLAAYGKCMLAPTNFMIKACIREVTRALAPDEIVHQTRTGSTGEDTDLERVGMHAVETAEPDSPLEGLDGGMNGQAAERSSVKFLQKVDSVGDSSKVTEEEVPDATGWVPEPGCTSLGLGGCDSPSEGGIKTHLKAWALAVQKNGNLP